MEKSETYYILKRCGKLNLMHVYQYDRNRRQIIRTTNFTGVMGYFKENITAFWDLLSEDQKYKSIIISATLLSKVNNERMTKALRYLMSDRLDLFNEIYDQVWRDLKQESIQPEWFERYSDHQAIR